MIPLPTYQTHQKQTGPDVLCLSHLRWNFVFQRPQHLMSRFARERRVFYWEEPVYDSDRPHLTSQTCPVTGVNVVTPHLPPFDEQERNHALHTLLEGFARSNGIKKPLAWFYTPMALEFFPSRLVPSAVVYDCMDELSMFKGAPPQLHELEDRLLQIADVVFTGGVSLFEAKRSRHKNMYAFPSGVDVAHFAQSRTWSGDPEDQKDIPHPRLGFAGVIDERMDLELVEGIAKLRPDWQIVMIGPTAKIDPGALPRLPNIHWLGMKNYHDLPKYFAGWDAAIMPFAMNDATRFISPTKTPEFLSAGLPVVSTPVRDVVHPYGELGLVKIAETAEEFVLAADQSMMIGMCLKWRQRADEFLTSLSWDAVWSGMNAMLRKTATRPQSKPAGSAPVMTAAQGDSLRA